MIHRFIDTFGCDDLGFAFLSDGGAGSLVSIWLAKHDTSNFEITNTRVSGLGGVTPSLGDPMVSPNNCTVAYTYIPDTGTNNYVQIVPTNDSAAPTQVENEPNNAGGGLEVSCQTVWSPDSQYIVWASLEGALAANTGNTKLKRADADGSNVIDLFSTAYIPAPPVQQRVQGPLFSDDGTKILFYRDGTDATGLVPTRRVYTIDSDGTNVTLVATYASNLSGGVGEPCFLRGTTTVVYWIPATGVYHIVESDGTGDTVWFDDPDPFWGTTRMAALPNGTDFLALRFFPGDTAGQRYRVGYINSGGWTAFSPLRRSSGSSEKTRVPVLRQGRIWWADGYLDGVVSIATDGSDYTVEDNNQVIRGWFGQYV